MEASCHPRPITPDRLTARPQSAPPMVELPWIVQADEGPRTDESQDRHPRTASCFAQTSYRLEKAAWRTLARKKSPRHEVYGNVRFRDKLSSENKPGKLGYLAGLGTLQKPWTASCDALRGRKRIRARYSYSGGQRVVVPSRNGAQPFRPGPAGTHNTTGVSRTGLSPSDAAVVTLEVPDEFLPEQ